MWDWRTFGIRLLIDDGCKIDDQYAREALLLMGKPPPSYAGRTHVPMLRCGEIQRIDYTATPLQIGTLHFSVIDMGYVFTLAASTQKALRTPNRMRNNQCATSRLSDVGEFNCRECPKRTPIKSRVEAIVSHFRQLEY